MDKLKFVGVLPLKNAPPADCYELEGGCSVLVSREDRHGTGQRLLHLSIAHPDRYPNWDEIKGVRYRLMPKDKTIIMYLPKPEEYVNVHKNCFHLWEEPPGAEPQRKYITKLKEERDAAIEEKRRIGEQLKDVLAKNKQLLEEKEEMARAFERGHL